MNTPSSTLGQTAVFGSMVLVLALLNSLLNPAALDLSRDYFAKAHDFQTVSEQELLEYLPEFYDEAPFFVCLDARDATHYANGHIPGAYLLDHYRQDDYLEAVLPALREAAFIIVYCAGGDCEDSIFLATDLVYRHGIEKEVLYIYEGGTEEWEAKGHPMKEGMER